MATEDFCWSEWDLDVPYAGEEQKKISRGEHRGHRGLKKLIEMVASKCYKHFKELQRENPNWPDGSKRSLLKKTKSFEIWYCSRMS